MQTVPTRWDVFCSVVDNFGDIGVCWRLCRQLAAEFGFEVRLWLDDLAALRRLWPAANMADHQQLAGVWVRRWEKDTVFPPPADVVIEAFACRLPPAYLVAMAERTMPPVWLNLEYLSAEQWVETCHGLPSPDPASGLAKHFFFPGFAPATGGLLREHSLLTDRDAFVAASDSGAQRAPFLAELGVTRDQTRQRQLLSLFAYNPAIDSRDGAVPGGNETVTGLLAELASAPDPWLCLVPAGQVTPLVASALGVTSLPPGTFLERGAVAVKALPFLQQDDYDRLLWSCDLNIVRGEDSFVRAQWAGKPMLWHIYPQEEGAHWAKLDAFLDRYTQGLPASLAMDIRTSWCQWNAGRAPVALAGVLRRLPELTSHARAWAAGLASQPDLATKLVLFCTNSLANRV